jgi:uncharacterized membrane protein YhhN
MNTPVQSPTAAPTIAGSRSRYAARICFLVSLLATCVVFLARILDIGDARFLPILVASTGYLLTAGLGGAFRSVYGRFVWAGLLCCWLGDMVGPHDFLLGAYAFLLAHLCFVPAFLTLGQRWRVTAAAALCVSGIGWLVLGYLLPEVPGPERPAILAYTTVISLMVVTACGVHTRNRIIPTAAILFYISDLFVAQWQYGGGDWNGLICYPLYYLACLLFASSTWRQPAASATGS